MAAKSSRLESTLRFHAFLRQLYEEGNKQTNKEPLTFETDVQGHLIGEGNADPLETIWSRNGVMFVIEKVRPHEETNLPEEQQINDTSLSEISPKESCIPLALPVSRARQLISFYTMSQNPNMTHLKSSNLFPLPPLWVRCDRSDPKQTAWLGAEPLSTRNQLTGINLHTVTSKGPISNKDDSANLEELKETHRIKHHSLELTTKGFARFEFLEATSLDSLSLEDTLLPFERNIYADFAWNNVTKILQPPPLTSTATLKIQMTSGSPLDFVYELNRELQFLLGLAKSLKTGLHDWPKPLEGKPAVELVQKLLKDLKDKADGLKTPNDIDAESLQGNTAAVFGSMKMLFHMRGDLDFVEQLWCNMWKNVASYDELVTCFTLIMKSLQNGDLQTWIHQGSNSLLSKLIKQSYHGSIEMVCLSGDAPVQMLLEIGVDKMKRDYISYFLGNELAVSTHLDYFLSGSVDLQEQVHCVQKLHHMLEIVENGVELLKLKHENLLFLTQSCINYYKENPLNEKHVFQLPVKPDSLKEFYQCASPQIWRVEISSGEGQKKVKTLWQLSTSAPAEHMDSSSTDDLDNTSVSDHKEGVHFITLAKCNQIYFV